MLADIRDRRIRQQIINKLHTVKQDPESAGKPLVGELSGCYSIRAAAGRYRVIYRIVNDRLIVLVVAVGIRRESDRRDIYEVARRLIRNRLVDPG